MKQKIAELESKLNDFSLPVRTQALQALLSLVEQGDIKLPVSEEIANMHCHTFFSFNGYGHSPTSLAWLARRQGIKLIGSVDFDVLDAVDEFLNACDRVGVRASTGIETRVFIPEYASCEINSPGEPGVDYHMGVGFTSSSVPESVAPILADMRKRATERNQAMLARINEYLNPIAIDYTKDVLSLTPNGNATERHILAAYLQAVERTVSNPVMFWSDKLHLEYDYAVGLMSNRSKFQDVVRAKLMKRGGVGYTQPGPDTFPTIDEIHQFIEACGALPCATWLDGTSAGERDIEALLALLIDKGVVVLNIIPDRNWNIADQSIKKLKLQKLYDVVNLAEQLDLPLNIGTEMNAFGQKLVDDFNAPELAPVRKVFMDGAHFIYGHTVMQRVLGLGYQSHWSKTWLPTRHERNNFYTAIGYKIPPGQVGLSVLKQFDENTSPQDFFTGLKD